MKEAVGTTTDAEEILNSLKDDLLVTTEQGVILRATQATAEIYQIPYEQLIGRTVYELESEGVFSPAITPIVLKKKEKVTIVQSTNKGKKLLVTGIPVVDKSGDIHRVVSYSHDVTELLTMKSYLSKMEDEMMRVKDEIQSLKREQLSADGLIAEDKKMKMTLQMAKQVSDVDVNVLLLGESGVGKSLIAKYIHNLSSRKKKPFIEVNCGAIPQSLFEAEFFGYEAGSFTGASRSGKMGLAELAEGGTLFLDEVGELSLENQVKLLKLIQEKQFYRVGGTKLRKVDFRLLAATNQHLQELVEQKLFREDLYFRLNVVPIHVPSLQERSGDLVPLIYYFLDYFSQKYHRTRELDDAVMEHLINHKWKGNVRELMNLIERLVVTTPSQLISVDNLPESYRSESNSDIVYHLESTSLKDILEKVEGKVFLQAKEKFITTTKIAEKLGISQPTAVRKLKKYNID